MWIVMIVNIRHACGVASDGAHLFVATAEVPIPIVTTTVIKGIAVERYIET